MEHSSDEVAAGSTTDMDAVQESPKDTPSSLQDCGRSQSTEDGSTVADLQSGIDRLLIRHRNEIMFEMRRLQHGDRPVTGDDERRQAISDLVSRFTRPPNTTDHTQTTGSSQRSVARPEHIMVEVNALVERRPVSSILQSFEFRSSIEQSLRGALGALRGDASIRQRALATARRTDSPQSASQSDLIDTQSIAQSSSDSEPRDTVTSPLRDLPVQPTGPDRAAVWLQQNVLPQNQQDMSTVEFVERLQHDDLITEISQLIQSQLVTSSLEGPIRNVLERQMRQRLEQSGTDGHRVQQLIRRLPRSHIHQRNDFWDLGIMAPGQQHNDNLDNLSMISATAAVALPQSYTQTTAAMSHEMRSMRQQITELKSMMQLSFDLQLDIQRAIRQEVSAAVTAAISTGSGASASVMDGSRSQRPPSDSGNCLICLDRAVDTAIYQCGHMCLCYSCAMQLRQREAHCPVCRAPIRDIMRIYRSA